MIHLTSSTAMRQACHYVPRLQVIDMAGSKIPVIYENKWPVLIIKCSWVCNVPFVILDQETLVP